MDLPIKTLTKNIKASADNGYEFEIVLNSRDIDASGFQRMLSYLCKDYVIEKTMNRTQLDVSTKEEDMRLSILGKDNIMRYCKDNTYNHSSSTLMRKRRAPNMQPLRIEEYSLRNNVNLEEEIREESAIKLFQSNMKGSTKHFRYKRRYSFFDKNKTHRVDMTSVKSSKVHDAKTLRASKALTNVEHFEVEVEFLNETQTAPEVALEHILHTVTELLKRNANVNQLLSTSKRQKVLMEYVHLVDKKVSTELVDKNPGRYILRYQPVTLTKRNMLPEDVDVASVLKDYSVTAKADGERYLVYISGESEVFLINNRLTIKSTGLVHPTMKKCIMDGEYITKGKLGIEMNTLLLFDIYFLNGKDVRGVSLPDRHKHISNVLRDWNTGELTMELKRFFYGSDDIKQETNTVMDYMKTLEYHTDGLIYTPLHLSPGALYKNDTSMNAFGGTWNRVFKWKPPEENSIDVLMKFGNECFIEDENGVSQKCIYVDMYVAYKGAVEQKVDVMGIYDTLDSSIKRRKGPVFKEAVVKRRFDFTYLLINPDRNLPLTEDGEPIETDTIVEMWFKNGKIDKWAPMRVRNDKTELYKMTNGRIENTANSYNTAMNVWMSILEPITVEILDGTTSLDPTEVKQDKKDLYYAREIPRYRSMLKPMLDFHNQWVKKRNMFSLFAEKNMRLLEIGCGQGGDLQKWIETGFSTVVGVDNNLDNLLNSESGAYRRLSDSASSKQQYNSIRLDPAKQHMVFLLMDGGKKWTAQSVDEIEDEPFKQFTEIAWGVTDKTKLSNQLVKKTHNILNVPFDVISCQFAIHYFFESIDTLENFCWNVNERLADNGYFMGTALDGHLVNKAFVDDDSSLLKGVMNEKVLWQIEKRYDAFEQESSGFENIGKKVDVYMETINKIIPEYLVDFKLLERTLGKYNIKLVDIKNEDGVRFPINSPTGSFQMLWKTMEMESAKTGAKNTAFSSMKRMSPEVKRYSFLNRWFVFKKYT